MLKCQLEVDVQEDHATTDISRNSLKEHSTSYGEHAYPSLARVVKSSWFEVAIGVAIVLNCVTMGIQADTLLGHAENMELFVHASDHFFTALFAIELGLRLFVLGWKSFAPWYGGTSNLFDAIIVLISGVLMVWILPLLGISPSNALRTFSVLRACRLVRLVRVAERVPAFQEIWRLMRGLIESMHTLFWTLALIFVVTYIFAVFGVVLISTEVKDLLKSETLEGNIEELEGLLSIFDGIFPMMHTLIQILTLDSWNGIVRPLMKHIWWSVFYFYAYISVGVIVLLNLVTAEIVDNAMKNSRKDEKQLLLEKQEEQKHLMQEFRSLFQMVDGDADGTLTWNEFQDAFKVPEVATKLKMLDFEPQSCHELFSLLDSGAGGDGALTLEEFFDGIQAMQGPAKSKDSFKLLKLVENTNKTLQDLADGLPHLTRENGSDKLGPDEESQPQRQELHKLGPNEESQPQRQEVHAPASRDDFPSKLSRKLLTVPPSISPPRSPVGLYSTGPLFSPAFTASRRQQMHSFDNVTESTVDSSSRSEDVADQVVACNHKVDSLATAMAEIQKSLTSVMQRLDCN